MTRETLKTHNILDRLFFSKQFLDSIDNKTCQNTKFMTDYERTELLIKEAGIFFHKYLGFGSSTKITITPEKLKGALSIIKEKYGIEISGSHGSTCFFRHIGDFFGHYMDFKFEDVFNNKKELNKRITHIKHYPKDCW